MPYFFLISTRSYSLLSSSSPRHSFLLFSNLALFFPHFYSFIFLSCFILTLLFVSFFLAISPYFFLISTRVYSLLSSSFPYHSFLLFSNLALFFPHFYSFIFPSFLILTILFVSFIYQSWLIISSFLLVHIPFFPHPHLIIRFFYLPILPYFTSFLLVHIPFFPHPHHIIRFFYLPILTYYFLISTRSYSLLSSSSPNHSFLLFTNLALFFLHFYSFIFPSFLILSLSFVSFI